MPSSERWMRWAGEPGSLRRGVIVGGAQIVGLLIGWAAAHFGWL